ncbi:hypothetical protein KKA66_02745, partial [Patescibacteria group bacterium]|nr:hypothetical protein [Patescibacteria group bacterium]
MIAAFIFLGIFIFNFSGITNLISNYFYNYINQDVRGKVAGESIEYPVKIAQSNNNRNFHNQLHTFRGAGSSHAETDLPKHARQMGYDYTTSRLAKDYGLGFIAMTDSTYFYHDACYKLDPSHGWFRNLDQPVEELLAEYDRYVCVRDPDETAPEKRYWISYATYRPESQIATVCFYLNFQSQEAIDKSIEYHEDLFDWNNVDAGFLDQVHSAVRAYFIRNDETKEIGSSITVTECKNNQLHPDITQDYSVGQGKREYIKALQNMFKKHGLPVSANVWKIRMWSQLHLTLPFDHYYNEEGRTSSNTADNNTDGSWSFGNIPADLASVEVPYPPAEGNEENFDLTLLSAGIAGNQGSWFGSYGESRDWIWSDYPDRNAVQLLRAMPNWDNLRNIPLSERSWNGHVYQSSNSYADQNIVYSYHGKDGRLFVVFRNRQGHVPLNGKQIQEIYCADDIFIESDICSNNIYQDSGELKLSQNGQLNKGYIVIYEGMTPPSCTCSSWTDGECGGGACSSAQMRQTRDCPNDCSYESQCIEDSQCSSTPPPPTGDDPIARSCWDDVKGHCYPRRGVMHFGKPAPAEWYAKFDYVIMRSKSTNLAQDIKVIDPSTLVFSTLDWNAGAGLKPSEHNEWIIKTSDDKSINLYNASNVFAFDFSDYAPALAKYNNQRYNEYLPEYLIIRHGLNVFDGIATDGLWNEPWAARKTYQDIDLDKNQINDYDEHGRSWVDNKWQAGVDKVFTKLEQLMPAGKSLIINSGSWHDFNISDSNGAIQEYGGSEYNFGNFKTAYNRWMQQARTPHLMFYNAIGPSKNSFSRMRFSLGLIMYGDGYSSYVEQNLHHYDAYYDEYDLNLGYPTSEMQLIRSTGANNQGVYVRFFDNGAVITNIDDNSQTITDNDIKNINGYAGPYYKFKGGQDPDFNNGQQFDQVSLDGRTTSGDWFVGDAVILTKEPTVMVTDIFVDDDNESTSPGSQSAALTNNWNQTCDDINNQWSQGCRTHSDEWGLAYSTTNQGTAIFTPTINVPGNYAVYEWHGNITDKQEASNVPYIINHSNGQAQGTIDQTRNQGQWNKLGIYNLSIGTNNNVTISAQGSNGTVIADAIRFVYQGNKGNIKGPPGDYIPAPPKVLSPDFNCDNKVDIQDFGILLSNWHKSHDVTANYKHNNCTNIKSIDLVIDKNNRVDSLD